MSFKQKITGVLMAATLAVPILPGQAWAGTGSIYLTPGSSSLQSGGSETLSLRINPGATVDGVQATVTFNAGALQLNSVDASASPFNLQLQKTVGSGSVTLALGNLSGGVHGDALVASFNFTALAGSGSSTLSVSNANATSGGAYTNPATSGATINLTPTGAGGLGGGYGSSSVGSSGGVSSIALAGRNGVASSAASAGASTPAASSNSQTTIGEYIAKVTQNSATVSVTAVKSQKIYVVYGTNPSQLAGRSADFTGTKAQIQLGQGGSLMPGTHYYYQVVAEDSSGNQTRSPLASFTTTGFSVHITVLDEHSQPLVNTKVTLHSQAKTATTDKDGIAMFSNVLPGLHHLEYLVGGTAYSAPVYIEANNAPNQNVAVVLPVSAAASRSSGPLAGLAVLIALALFMGSTEIFRHYGQVRRKLRKLFVAGLALR